MREGCFCVGGPEGPGGWPGVREGCFCSAGERDLVYLYRYRLLFSVAQVLAEPAVSLVDQLPVDVRSAGFDDRAHALAVVGRAARDGRLTRVPSAKAVDR